MAGVPIREQAINQNAANLFGKGDTASPSQLEVAAQDPTEFDTQAQQKGKLQRVSPPETTSRSFCAWSRT
eukprot:6088743-Lingulodinium_polyedra.AAC.1